MTRIPHRSMIVDGIRFDSAIEAQRYSELKLMQAAGEIHDLECHPSFELQPAFRIDGHHERALKYTADFKYWEGDDVIVEEVKSSWSKKETAYNIRRKLFLFKYGHEVEFREVVK